MAKYYRDSQIVICPVCDFEHDDQVHVSGGLMCANCGSQFQVEVRREKTGEKIKLPNQNREHDEYKKTFTCHPLHKIQIPIPNAKDLDDAKAKLDRGEMTPEDYKRYVLNSKLADWNPEHEPHPNAVGNEKSRAGFKWHTGSVQGRIMQSVVKKTGMKAIDIMHGSMKKKYDGNIFVFEDNRLETINQFLKAFSAVYMTENPYKKETMDKAADVILGIVKEDLPYRARLILLINEFIKKYPNGFPLTEDEIENIEVWR